MPSKWNSFRHPPKNEELGTVFEIDSMYMGFSSIKNKFRFWEVVKYKNELRLCNIIGGGNRRLPLLSSYQNVMGNQTDWWRYVPQVEVDMLILTNN